MKIVGMANSLYHIINGTLLDGYNDVSGDTITLSFSNDELKRMHVQGGARGAFYPEQKNSSLDTTIYYTANVGVSFINKEASLKMLTRSKREVFDQIPCDEHS